MGCGAVGGVLAGGLLRANHDLTIVAHNEHIARAIAENGLQVMTPDGEYTVPASVHLDPTTVAGPFDIVLLTMKATAVVQAVRDALPLLAKDGVLVPLQNGVVEDRVSEMAGRERVVGGIVVWGATMHAHGVYEMTSHDETVIGELDGRATPRVQEIMAVLDAAVPAEISDNIYGVLWSKLAINCIITTLGAASGQLLGEMLRQRTVRRLALSIISEVVDVAEARGIVLEKAGGTLDLHQLYLPPERRAGGFGLDLIKKHAIMLAIAMRYRKLKSSMLQSLERGREPEIDFMNGYVVEQGQQVGISTPVNAALTEMVREIEAGARPISPDNLKHIG